MATVPTRTGQPGPTAQDIMANDRNAAPAIMRLESPTLEEDLPDFSIERYFSKE